jgi:hypothetical protein
MLSYVMPSYVGNMATLSLQKGKMQFSIAIDAFARLSFTAVSL